jgi:hypothetical protein
MLSCKETTALASQRLDEKLSWSTRSTMWVHLLICVHCRRYVKQLRTVVAVIARHVHRQLTDEEIRQQTEVLKHASDDINKK